MPKGKKTRERIVDEAASLFNHRGFEGSSMSELSDLRAARPENEGERSILSATGWNEFFPSPVQTSQDSAPVHCPIPFELPHIRYAKCHVVPGTLAWRTQFQRRASLSQNVRYRGTGLVRSASLSERPLRPQE